MSNDFPRSIMSRASKLRGGQGDNREGSPGRRGQQQEVLTGAVAILWDMENCPVPTEVKADDVAGNIRMALRMHPVIQGAVTFFSAYGDFNHFPRKVREGCQRTGVNLIDVPNGKKDASDKAILVDLFLFALDNSPPCTIFLISGDVDFAPALHKLGQRGYTVVLAIPSGVGVSSALCSAGRFVWDWPSVARGGGLVPAKNFSSRSIVDDRIAEINSRSTVDERMAEIIELNSSAGQPAPAWSHDDDSDLASDDPVPYEEEQIVWRSPVPPIPPRFLDNSVADRTSSSKMDIPRRNVGSSGFQSSFAKSPPQPKGLSPPTSKELGNQPSGSRETDSALRGQAELPAGSSIAKGSSQNLPPLTEDLQILKEQLVRLLSLNGGKMELSRVPADFQKQYGKPLQLADYGYGGTKLVNLLERFREWLFMRGEGVGRTVHLTKNGSRVAAKLRRDAKSRGAPREEEGESLRGSDSTKAKGEDVVDVDDETAGEEVIVGNAQKGLQKLITEVQSLLASDKDPQKKEGEQGKECEEIQLPNYDWGFGSGGSVGSGDEKDNSLQDEKDVEVDESTLEQVVKSKGNSRAGLSILDVFRLEVQELLVSYACNIHMTSFVKLYEQRYSHALDYEKFGVKDLESLIEKVRDVAVIMEDPKSKLKVLVANRRPDGRTSERPDGRASERPESPLLVASRRSDGRASERPDGRNLSET